MYNNNYKCLEKFADRMMKVSPQVLLHINIDRKETLHRVFGFNNIEEKTQLVYMLLTYIQDQSLKDEECTLEDMSYFLRFINEVYFNKDIQNEDYMKLANCIVNEVILNDGAMTYFNCINTDNCSKERKYIQLIDHKKSEISNVATYFLTQDGYDLVLSSLEISTNMRLSFHGFLLQESLQRSNYDKALKDVESIFLLSKRQIKETEKQIIRIRENVLKVSAIEFNKQRSENMEILRVQHDRFKSYIDDVKLKELKLLELQEDYQLDGRDEDLEEIFENLKKLNKIKKMLNNIVSEQGKLNEINQEYNTLYQEAILKNLVNFSLEKVNAQEELQDKMIDDITHLGFLDFLIRPLFTKPIKKTFSLDSIFDEHKNTTRETATSSEVLLKISKEDKERIRAEEKKKIAKSHERYEKILYHIFDFGLNVKNNFTLQELNEYIQTDENKLNDFFPDRYQTRNTLIGLYHLTHITYEGLKTAIKLTQSGYEDIIEFQPVKSIKTIIDKNRNLRSFKSISVIKEIPSSKVLIKSGPLFTKNLNMTEVIKNIGNENVNPEVYTLTVDNLRFIFNTEMED